MRLENPYNPPQSQSSANLLPTQRKSLFYAVRWYLFALSPFAVSVSLAIFTSPTASTSSLFPFADQIHSWAGLLIYAGIFISGYFLTIVVFSDLAILLRKLAKKLVG